MALRQELSSLPNKTEHPNPNSVSGPEVANPSAGVSILVIVTVINFNYVSGMNASKLTRRLLTTRPERHSFLPGPWPGPGGSHRMSSSLHLAVYIYGSNHEQR